MSFEETFPAEGFDDVARFLRFRSPAHTKTRFHNECLYLSCFCLQSHALIAKIGFPIELREQPQKYTKYCLNQYNMFNAKLKLNVIRSNAKYEVLLPEMKCFPKCEIPIPQALGRPPNAAIPARWTMIVKTWTGGKGRLKRRGTELSGMDRRQDGRGGEGRGGERIEGNGRARKRQGWNGGGRDLIEPSGGWEGHGERRGAGGGTGIQSNKHIIFQTKQMPIFTSY